MSVVIPCYNYAAFITDAIDSARTQTAVSVDIIVVDDYSSDDSAEVVAAIVARDPRVRLIRHDRNQGPVRTFNDGLALARGDFIVRLDADDLLTPGSLGRAAAVAEAFPSVGLVYGHPLHFTGDELPRPRLAVTRWVIWPGRYWLEQRCRTGVNVITSPEVLMRRAVVDRVGGQRDLPHTHDMEMWLRIASVSDVAYIEGADQAWHREHGLSLSQSLTPGFGDLQDRRDAFTTLFEWTEPRMADTERLRAAAQRALADESLRAVVHQYDRGRVDKELQARLLAFAEGAPVGGKPLPHAAEAARLIARGPRRPAPWQVARAASRRLRARAEYARWHRHGVFTRDRRS
ncbi:glycosyltransferase family 2 protein [Microbacterium sp. zg.Y909]|uniref:glycosyltransferase family 2 protein n=1 Tax=Microbacterium sp. zg.Y909 TaxID=2969413 RepID=UPI00214CB09B|nr:glycosyltransferase family 2 protein [Microbacterium sp. zg.Y909]MCR2823919.1 glycosyltransferase [Microbacterium sp. zg.Y909]